MANFFIPLVILVFCYLRICHVIWENFNSKTINLEGTNEKTSFTKKICRALRIPNSERLCKEKSNCITDEKEENDFEKGCNAADKFRVKNEEALEKIQWQNQSEFEGKYT